MSQAQADPQPRAPWMKIFSAFKVALDLKKLALAAAGIVLAWLGCWLFSVIFFLPRTFPEWKNYHDPQDERRAWDTFKSSRNSWNLIHEMAGSTPTIKDHYLVDAADVANSLDEFKLLDEWEKAHARLKDKIVVTGTTLEVPKMIANQKTFKLAAAGEDSSALAKLDKRPLPLAALHLGEQGATIDGVAVKIVEGNVDELRKYRDSAWTLEQIAARAATAKDPAVAQAAFENFKKYLVNPAIKAGGLLRVSPLSEPRGVNPYLLVTGAIKTGSGPVDARGHLLDWLLHDELPVLLEPLYKLLMPLRYLFDPRAGWLDRLYLVLVILWTLSVWGFLGGAICRIAAVQVARNERISLTEAITFTKDRAISFIAAPMLPLVLVLFSLIALIIFGWIDCIPWFGDLVAGLFWPVVLIIGLIMTVVLVGLVAWPLMIATISTEGSDSFDALSRSYSYLYQAPWQLAWYSFLALVYGAVLVFFVGFMGSTFVYLGKWGVASTPFLASREAKHDREPSYLFMYAPTSFGWRDLLLSQSNFKVDVETVRPDGRLAKHLDFTDEYKAELSGPNYMGAGLMVIWIWPLFLLIVGFGYSYFWSASTIIYMLMRRYVDDTEVDEIYLEDDDIGAGFAPPPAAPPPEPMHAAPMDQKPGAISLSLVDAPPAPPASPLVSINNPPPANP